MKHVTAAETSVSHDSFPGAYFWVIIQPKVLTKLEFCANPSFPPFAACKSRSDGMSAVQVTTPLWCLGISPCLDQGPETYFRFSGKHLVALVIPPLSAGVVCQVLPTSDEDFIAVGCC